MQCNIANDVHAFKLTEFMKAEYARSIPSDIEIMDVEGALVAYRIQPGLGLELWAITGHPCGFGFRSLTAEQHAQAVAFLEQEQDTWNAPQKLLCDSLAALLTTERYRTRQVTRLKHWPTAPSSS